MITCVRRRKIKAARTAIKIFDYVHERGLFFKKCDIEQTAKDLGINVHDVMRACRMMEKAGLAQIGKD